MSTYGNIILNCLSALLNAQWTRIINLIFGDYITFYPWSQYFFLNKNLSSQENDFLIKSLFCRNEREFFSFET
jgi:hypothetical protein